LDVNATLSPRPRVLLVSTCHWLSPARLAVALVAAGCEVVAVCPRGHPLTRIHGPSRIHPYHPLTPVRSIDAAIDDAQPRVVIPCDDVATLHLHRLYDLALGRNKRGTALQALLVESLGAPASFPIAASRAALMAFAQEIGVRVPATAAVRTTDELRRWLFRNGLPAVLKADGTYGARGVRVVHTDAEAVDAFRVLTSPPRPARALKRAIVNRDWSYTRLCALQIRPAVSVQRFVAGPEANSTVSCHHGEVVASISARVLRTLGENGPASALQIVDHADIADSVGRIVRNLKLSGLFGFDFVLEEGTGAPYLIEMNPRATQVSHLRLGPDRDLPGSIRAIAAGEPVRDTPPLTARDVIALFPQEWRRDPASRLLREGYHDVPWESPDLVSACLREDLRSRVWSALSSGIPSILKTLRRRPASPVPGGPFPEPHCQQVVTERERRRS
jgi:hypothetical protein